MSVTDYLLVKGYAPPMESAEIIEKWLVAIEDSLDDSLKWTVDEKDRIKEIPDRCSLIQDELETNRNLPFVFNGKRGAPTTLVADIIDGESDLSPKGGSIQFVHLKAPIGVARLGMGIIESFGDLIACYWAVASPLSLSRMTSRIAASLDDLNYVDPDNPVPPGFPRMYHFGEKYEPWNPDKVGWLNYWSPKTCEHLGFPDESKDRELLKRSKRLKNGAWIVRLTDDPMDPSRPEHLEILRWAYRRFDSLGVRG